MKTGFKKDTPGDDWFIGLKKRHPDVTMKKPQKLSVTRAKAMNRDKVNSYFALLKGTLDKLKVQPDHIWNCDETNMQLEHKPTSVVGRKGGRVPGRVANSKESVTVLGCGNASGKIMSPMVIVKGKTKRSLMGWKTEDAPPETKWTYQPKSYMDQALGSEWFQSVFLKECGPHRPQLLVLDSHCSHEPLELIEMAEKENIILLTLPSHCTHWLQPWDKSMFSPLKRKYNALCSEYMAENNTHNITKNSWPKLFFQAWRSAITSVNMVSGFVSTGIWPFNPNAIPNEAFLTSIADSQSETTITSGVTDAHVENGSQTSFDGNQILVTAEVHAENNEEPSAPVILDFPIMVNEGTEVISLPVSFDNDNETQDATATPDLSGVILEEIEGNDIGLPSEYWNRDVESIFLPTIDTPVSTKKHRVGLSSSRILTSPEVIQAKMEMAELKEKKAKAAQERKARAQERKLITQEKRLAKAIKSEVKNKKK